MTPHLYYGSVQRPLPGMHPSQTKSEKPLLGEKWLFSHWASLPSQASASEKLPAVVSRGGSCSPQDNPFILLMFLHGPPHHDGHSAVR